jgi:hypothetical protein
VTTKKAILLGCGAAALLGLCAVIGVVLFITYVAKDVEGMVVSVKGPESVAVGETFDLEIVVRNDRPRQSIELSDVDLADEYLEGFTIASVHPVNKSSSHVPIDNKRSFTFDVTIPPGQSRTFAFKMRAQKAGIYRGDVDVCEGARFTTGMLQTAVTAKE